MIFRIVLMKLSFRIIIYDITNILHKNRISMLVSRLHETIDLFHRQCLCYQLQSHECATVIIKHNYMLMCNHKIVINKMLCLVNSTEHKSRSIVDLQTHDDTRNRSIHIPECNAQCLTILGFNCNHSHIILPLLVNPCK